MHFKTLSNYNVYERKKNYIHFLINTTQPKTLLSMIINLQDSSHQGVLKPQQKITDKNLVENANL